MKKLVLPLIFFLTYYCCELSAQIITVNDKSTINITNKSSISFSGIELSPSIQNFNPAPTSAFGGTPSRTTGFVILLDTTGYGQFYPYNHAAVSGATPIVVNGNSYSYRCLNNIKE